MNTIAFKWPKDDKKERDVDKPDPDEPNPYDQPPPEGQVRTGVHFMSRHPEDNRITIRKPDFSSSIRSLSGGDDDDKIIEPMYNKDASQSKSMDTLGIEPSGNSDVDETRLVYHGTIAPTLEEVIDKNRG